MHSIAIVIDFWGAPPPWVPVFLESCRWNPSIDWIIHTDQSWPYEALENVRIVPLPRSEYVRRVSEALEITFQPDSGYKICDIRPAFGEIYRSELDGYEFFGYGDLDVVYGNIRAFYTDGLLHEHDVLSTHEWCISGHLALYRNTDQIRGAFRQVPDWQAMLEQPDNVRFDEDHFGQLFKGSKADQPDACPANGSPASLEARVYAHEQFSTPLTPAPWVDGRAEHPHVWYWKNGEVTNDLDTARRFLYLHLMNFKGPRFVGEAYESGPFWDDLTEVMHIGIDDIRSGVRIDRQGFHRIASGA